MLRYSVKRLLQSLVTIFIVISVVFLLLRLMPLPRYFEGDQWIKQSWEVKLAKLQKLGMYDAKGEPINPFVQLLNFYKSLLTSFDFGESTVLQPGRPVTTIVKEKMGYSLAFGTVATALSLLFGYVLGIAMARGKGKLLDHIGTFYIAIALSVPPVVYYLLLQIYGTKLMKWPMIYFSSRPESWVMPVVVLTIGSMAGVALWMRRYMVDELNKDYVKLAYAKGLSGKRVMYTHVLRNAFVPMSYVVPGAFIGALSGSLIVEQIFSIPGMGRLLINAINKCDNNVVQTVIFLYTSLGILSVFLGDVLMTIADPRIRLTEKEGAR